MKNKSKNKITININCNGHKFNEIKAWVLKCKFDVYVQDVIIKANTTVIVINRRAANGIPRAYVSIGMGTDSYFMNQRENLTLVFDHLADALLFKLTFGELCVATEI
jgi:hypothetical protein